MFTLQKIASIALVASVPSCSAIFHDTAQILGFEKKPTPTPAPAGAPPDGAIAKMLAEDEDHYGHGEAKPTPSPVPTAPPKPTPIPSPIDLSTGDAVLKANGKYTIYTHNVPRSKCSAGYDERVAFYSANAAVMTARECRTIAAKTLSPRSFAPFAGDTNVIRVGNSVFDLATSGRSTNLVCEGEDSAQRRVTLTVATFSENNAEKFLIRLNLAGTDEPEVYELPAISTTKKGMLTYESGAEGKQPYISVLQGHFNGVTAFVTYDLDAAQQLHPHALAKAAFARNRKETNLSLPSCYVP